MEGKGWRGGDGREEVEGRGWRRRVGGEGMEGRGWFQWDLGEENEKTLNGMKAPRKRVWLAGQQMGPQVSPGSSPLSPLGGLETWEPEEDGMRPGDDMSCALHPGLSRSPGPASLRS